jgi:hypothetical protein
MNLADYWDNVNILVLKLLCNKHSASTEKLTLLFIREEEP